MNIEDKKKAIKKYCKNHGDCADDPECPLWMGIPNDDHCWCCTDEEIERNYKILSQAGVINDEDIINHPNHYTNGGMECIDEMLLIFGEETVAHFCLCNAWKYRYRALTKNGQEDIDKSHWYINKYKELVKRMVRSDD